MLIILFVLTVLLVPVFFIASKKMEKEEDYDRAKNYYNFGWFMVAWSFLTGVLSSSKENNI